MDGQKSRIPHKDWEHYKIADPVKPGERLKVGPILLLAVKVHSMLSQILPKVMVKS